MIATRGGKLGRGTGFGVGDDGDPAYTVTAAHGHAVCAGFKFHAGSSAGSIAYQHEQSPTITADWHSPAVCIQGSMIGRSDAAGPQGSGINDDVAVISQYGEVAGTLTARYDSSPCPDRGQNIVGNGSVVRRLTPRECERLQGMPTVVDLEVAQMTPDEAAACALANGDIFCDLHAGKVYGRRGPGGALRPVPVELGWMHPSGYVHINLSANGEKHQVRAHRVIYMAAYGHIPDGMVVDHINNDKSDNRIGNLQLMTAKENSAKAARDGRYPTGEMNGRSKLTVEMRTRLLYDHQHGLSYRQLAQKYGVSKSRVGQIVQEDDWTLVPYRGKSAEDCPDGPRYKAIGNSMAVSVMRWIGEGIAMVDKLEGRCE